MELKIGSVLKTDAMKDIEIIEKIGEGGQGVVYKVKYENNLCALKWYYTKKIKNPKDFYKNIKNNIEEGSPNNAFLWPKAITKWDIESFGYIMDLRPGEYKDFSQFLLAKVRFKSVEAIVNSALNIIGAFRALHNKGFGYQDLNDGNFFINPHSGDVLICDNDNVAPYGVNLGIGGKCRYMAPEIVIGKAKPDVNTDKYSLGVVLFLLLFMNHPLEGRRTMRPCMTEELEHKFYGKEPIFIFDPKDDTNRPVRGVHVNAIKLWTLYPEYIRDIFVRAFSKEAMSEDGQRIIEKEWQEVFTRLRDELVRCKCGLETFINIEKEESLCINCGEKVYTPLLLSIKKYNIPLVPGKKLYLCHIDDNSSDWKEVSGEVIVNKKDNTKWGIRNLSELTWVGVLPNGTSKQINKNDVLIIAKNIKIKIGGLEGQII